ncbi:MAG: hypothetical protein ABI891_05955 [Acidobacteriota bacterium]
MSREVQLGKYEFYPNYEKIQHRLDKLTPTSDEEKMHIKEKFEKLLEQVKSAQFRGKRRKQDALM